MWYNKDMNERTNSRKLKRFVTRTLVFATSMSIFVGAGTYVMLSKKQTYAASTNIKFVNAASVDGYAYDGSLIEDVVKEITGTEVLDSAIKDEYMQDETTSNRVAKMISVDKVVPDDEQDRIDSALKNGKEYTYNPVEFKVSINSDLPQAGKLLNSIIRNFISYYCKNYVNPDTFPSNVGDLLENNSYDYIEQADMIRRNIEAVKAFLDTKASLDADYHCSTTGYSFADLGEKYDYLYNTKLPELYAKILSNKATKNPELLLQKLQQQNSGYMSSSEDTHEELEKLESMIRSYSEKNKSSGTITNGNFGDAYDENHTSIIEGIYENARNPESSYDSLFTTYISEHDLISTNNTSISYNEYLAEVFSDAETITNEELKGEIDNSIASILKELDTLYDLANTARLEHMDIESTGMIVQINTPISIKQLNVKMYAILALVAAFLFMVVAVPVVKVFIHNVKEFAKAKKTEAEKVVVNYEDLFD